MPLHHPAKLAILVVAGFLTACSTTPADISDYRDGGSGNLSAMVKEIKSDRLSDPFIKAGLTALDKSDFVIANKAFNKALKFDPTDSNLHFLNALTYHLRSQAGDSSQIEMAKVGYGLSLQYDSSNYWASYQLGQITFKEQRYKDAQDAFAYTLLYAPENPEFLRALATASYHAQDLETALDSISKASQIKPEDPDINYDSAMIHAAAGNLSKANARLAVFNRLTKGKASFRKANLTSRIGDWGRFHKNKSYLQLAQSTSDIFGSAATTEGVKVDSNDNSSSSSATKVVSTKMALVDVVIIRSEERMTTNKGVNLLSGLSATLGGTVTFNKVDALNGDTSTVTNNLTWAPALTFASSAYSLAIFNDVNDRNEVLARPTLVSLDGKKSEFFSGAIWHVELSGSAGSEGAVQDIPVGIKLDVTPKFIGKDMVELNVSAARAFVENRSSTANFNNFAQTSKTLVTANVAMKFGQTLILSGLSEKETETVRDGVPFLQDIPIVQYLFSNESTLDFTKSVLILLTPRKARYTFEDGTEKVDQAAPSDMDSKQESLKELQTRVDWFRPAANVDSVLHHLRNGKFFKEFHSGDVKMEKWDYPGRLERMIERTIQFIYY